MSRNVIAGIVGLLGAPAVLAFLSLSAVYADPPWCGGCAPDCGTNCQHTHCPPPFEHCQEKAPCIKYRCGCARPVCPPCQLEHYGYYETCWHPWPFPPDWSHCQAMPYAASVPLAGPPPHVMAPPMAPSIQEGGRPVDSERQLPPPRKLDMRAPSGL